MTRTYRRRQTPPGSIFWRATFKGEKGRPTDAAEVDGQLYHKGKPVQVSQVVKGRLETIENLRFEFEEV